MAKEIATKTKLDTRIAADIAAAMPVANQPAAVKAAAAPALAKKAIVIDTEEVQAAVEQAVEGSADVIVAQAAGASGAATGGAAAGGMSTTALVVAGVAVAAAAGGGSSSSTPAATTPSTTPATTPAAGPKSVTLTAATPNADYSGEKALVNVTLNGDDDEVDGTEFNVKGTEFDDSFTVVQYNQATISGAGGNDTLIMDDDQAVIDALRGEAYWDGKTTQVVEFTSIEKFVMGRDDDSFSGGVGAETITGGGGADTLDGGAGDDVFLFATTDDLDEADEVTGGLGTDTIQIGATRERDGYAIDMSALGNVTIAGVEKLVSTGVDEDGVAVASTLITINVDDLAGITKVTGASKGADTLSLIDTGGLNLSTWALSNLKEVTVDADSEAVTLRQDQLTAVNRWVSTNDDSLSLAVATGVTSQTFDLTKNYFNGWDVLSEASNIATTIVADQKSLAGFQSFDLTTNDTVQVNGDADLTAADTDDGEVSLVINGNVTITATDLTDDANDATQFKKVTATTDTAVLTADLGASGGTDDLDLSAMTLTGLKTIKTTGGGATAGDSQTILSAKTVFSGLTINTSKEVQIDATDKLDTDTYYSLTGLTLAGTNTTLNIEGQVALEQALVSSLKEISEVADGTLWVPTNLDLSSLSTLDVTAVQDTSASNVITGASSNEQTYKFTKGGDDKLVIGNYSATVEVGAASGSVEATFGNNSTGDTSLTVSKTTGTATNVTASFAGSGDYIVDIQSTSTGKIDLTFADSTLAKDTDPSIDVTFEGKGEQKAVLGNTLLADSADVAIGASGAVDLTLGTGYVAVDITGGTGAIKITSTTAGGHAISTSGAQSGNITISMGANLDSDDALTAGDGSIDLTDATGSNNITVGSGGWEITGGAGADTIVGGSGNDTINAGNGGDTIDLSGGGYDDVVIQSGGNGVVTSDASADFLSAARFTGYSTISSVTIGAASATSDQIILDDLDGSAGLEVTAFNTDALDYTANEGDVYLYTSTLATADLTSASEIVDLIGDMTAADGDEFYLVVNNTTGTTFALYKVILGADYTDGDNLTVDAGNSVELLALVNGNMTIANSDEYLNIA